MKALVSLLPALADSVPPRLRKRLDADPALARSWDWSTPGQIVTSNGETVTITAPDGVLRRLEDLQCSCLMAPNCLHRLAVLTALEPILETSEPETADEKLEPDESPSETLTEHQSVAAKWLWESGARLLEKGARNAGVLDLSEIQRAAFACRERGLFRAGAAGTRVARGLRDLRSDSTAFNLAEFAEDVRELLLVSYRLCQGDANQKGTARRAYQSIGNRKLFGLYSQPVITTSGYAGCMTVLGDSEGRRYEISDVMPGEPSRAVAVYSEAGRTLPGITVSHKELSHSAVLLQNGTASEDGRLGSGAGVRAALSGGSSWESQAVMEAEVVGVENEAVIAIGPNGAFRIAAIDHPALPTRDNLALLARWPERPLKFIGERHPTQERTFLVHAVECEIGRFNLALDRLRPAQFPALQPRPRQVQLCQEYRPFAEFLRRIQQTVLGGRRAALADPRAAAHWKSLGLSCGDFWQSLVQAAEEGRRDLRGLWIPEQSDRYALSWLAAVQYYQISHTHWLEAQMSTS